MRNTVKQSLNQARYGYIRLLMGHSHYPSASDSNFDIGALQIHLLTYLLTYLLT